MRIKSYRVLKNVLLRHFYANGFACVIFTQYICSIKLKISFYVHIQISTSCCYYRLCYLWFWWHKYQHTSHRTWYRTIQRHMGPARWLSEYGRDRWRVRKEGVVWRNQCRGCLFGANPCVQYSWQRPSWACAHSCFLCTCQQGQVWDNSRWRC